MALRTMFSMRLLAGAALLASSAAVAHAQETTETREAGNLTIRGSVLDQETGEPIEGAVLRLLPDGPDGLTGSNGTFKIEDVPPGQHDMEIHHVGYGTALVPVAISPGEALHLTIRLKARAIEMAPLQVQVEQEIRLSYLENRGFYERAEEGGGFGHFMTPREIERRNPLRVSHILQQMPGVGIQRDCGSGAEGYGRCRKVPYMKASAPTGTGGFSRSQNRRSGNVVTTDNRGMRGCPATVYVDGHKVAVGEMGLDAIVPATEISAIEVYRGASAMAPTFIDSDARCGVVVLWTRRGPRPGGN